MSAVGFCEVCGALLEQPPAGRRTGRRRRFCTDAHRQLAYRRRHRKQPPRVTKLDAELRNRIRAERDRRARLKIPRRRRAA